MEDQIIKVNEKGQITLPVKMRELEGIRPNDFVRVSYVPNMIFVDKVEDDSSTETLIELFRKLELNDEDWEEIKRERREADR